MESHVNTLKHLEILMYHKNSDVIIAGLSLINKGMITKTQKKKCFDPFFFAGFTKNNPLQSWFLL